MKTDQNFEIIDSDSSDTSNVPKGKDIFYQCLLCHELIPSQPNDNVGCRCGNIFVDIDSFRLAVRDFSSFLALRRTPTAS